MKRSGQTPGPFSAPSFLLMPAVGLRKPIVEERFRRGKQVLAAKTSRWLRQRGEDDRRQTVSFCLSHGLVVIVFSNTFLDGLDQFLNEISPGLICAEGRKWGVSESGAR